MRLAGALFCAVAICQLMGCAKTASKSGADSTEGTLQQTSSSQNRDLATLVALVEPAVVRINVSGNGTPDAIASGFVISEKGWIVTNNHVIEDAKSAVVHFVDGATMEVGAVLSHDSELDIAVLRVDSLPKGTRIATLATRKPQKGEMALALGTPRGLSFTATEGIVSAVRDGKEFEELGGNNRQGTWIQTSASITSGNSGGPLFDNSGNVIGMNTFVMGNSGDLGFAISAIDIASILKKIKSDDKGVQLPIGKSTTTAASELSSDQTLSPELRERIEAAKRVIESAIDLRTSELEAIASDLNDVRKSMKQAIIASDTNGEKFFRGRIVEKQAELKNLLQKPLEIKQLNPVMLKTLDVGQLGNRTFHVIQVLNKSTGSLLVADRRTNKIFKLYGIDAVDTVDGNDLQVKPSLVFMVLGTETYSTVSGSSNTVFQVGCIGDSERSDIFSTFHELSVRSLVVLRDDLNASELEMANKNSLARAKEIREREEAEFKRKMATLAAEEERRRIEKEKQVATEEKKRIAAEKVAAEVREKRSKTALQQGKTLRAKGNREQAKKYFQRAITEAPDSEFADEARKLLDIKE